MSRSISRLLGLSLFTALSAACNADLASLLSVSGNSGGAQLTPDDQEFHTPSEGSDGSAIDEESSNEDADDSQTMDEGGQSPDESSAPVDSDETGGDPSAIDGGITEPSVPEVPSIPGIPTVPEVPDPPSP